MRKTLAALVLVLAGFGGAARAQFCPGVTPWVFDDVEASDPFCGAITWMATSNVTLGCQAIDANHRLYCPDGLVTRKQMAAFMKRQAEAVMPLTCAAGQVMKWNGAAWACADDNIGGSGGGGTVTSVLAGTGLQGSPNPIVGAGSINLAPSYQLPQSCTNGQVPKSNGSGGWTCGADNAGAGTVTSVATGAGLTGGPITAAGTIAADTTYLQRRVGGTCPAGSSIRAIAADGTVTCQVDSGGAANAFVQGGNAFGATAVIGNNDDFDVEVRLTGSPVLRLIRGSAAPNIVAGSANNPIPIASGSVVGGGGSFNSSCLNGMTGTPTLSCANEASGNWSTVAGGMGNAATSLTASVGGGEGNNAYSVGATVAGGRGNAAGLGEDSTVAGGYRNVATGYYASVAGGFRNDATGDSSTVVGGRLNAASQYASTVGGGLSNVASGLRSTIPGGSENEASGNWSFAAGHRAKAQALGCFAWADATDADFTCNVPNGFFVRAAGGVRIFGPGNWNLESTEGDLRIGNDTHRLKFGVALAGVGAGDAWIRPHGGTERLYLKAPGGAGVLTNAAGSTGVTIAAGSGSWSSLSDRAAKRDLERVQGSDVLERLVAMPVYRWRYIEERSAATHLGPVAQDFRAAFGLGDDEKTIATVDADGVALAAIQGLNAKLEAQLAERDAQIRAMRAEIAALREVQADVAVLRAAVRELLGERDVRALSARLTR